MPTLKPSGSLGSKSSRESLRSLFKKGPSPKRSPKLQTTSDSALPNPKALRLSSEGDTVTINPSNTAPPPQSSASTPLVRKRYFGRGRVGEKNSVGGGFQPQP